MVASKEAQDGRQQTGVVVEQHREQRNKHAAVQLSCFGLVKQQLLPGRR